MEFGVLQLSIHFEETLKKIRTRALLQDWAMRPLIGFVFTKRKNSQGK